MATKTSSLGHFYRVTAEIIKIFQKSTARDAAMIRPITERWIDPLQV
jgi:hypothetical protein